MTTSDPVRHMRATEPISQPRATTAAYSVNDHGVDEQRAPSRGKRHRAGRWLILFSITTGTFMANVDATAVTVALPAMAQEYGVQLDALQWVISAYFLAITAVLPVFGRLADMVGRKHVLNTGLAVFVIASLLVALAPTFQTLIAWRVLQGIGASMFMATIMATAVTTFPPEERGRVLGLLTSIVAAGTLLGPAVGGLLTDAFGWRSIFFINVPIGLLGVLGTFVFLPAAAGTGGSWRQLDLPGAVLFAGFSSSLLFGLAMGPGTGWSSRAVLALLAAATLFVLLFAVRESRVSRPLIDLRLFRRRVFGFGNLAAFLSFVLMFFPAVLFPLYLHEVVGWSIAMTGLVMTVQAVAMLLVSPFSGWWSDRVGSMRPALAALGLLTVAMLGTAFIGPAAPSWLIGALLALLGAAFGLFLSPNNSAVMGDLGRHHAGTANGILATLRNLGKAVGVALAVLVYQAFAGTATTVGAPPDVFLAGFRGVFLTGAVLSAVALLAVVCMYRREEPGSSRRPASATAT